MLLINFAEKKMVVLGEKMFKENQERTNSIHLSHPEVKSLHNTREKTKTLNVKSMGESFKISRLFFFSKDD